MAFDAGAISGRIVLDVNGWSAGRDRVMADARRLAQTVESDLGRASASASTNLTASLAGVQGQFTATTPAAAELGVTIATAGDTMDRTARSASSLGASLNDPLGKYTREFEREIARARRALDGLDRDLDKISKSKSDPFLTLLKGAGVAAIVRQVSREVDQFGQAMSQAQIALANGDKSIADVTGDVARSLPLLGDFTKAFDSIRNAVTGAEAALARMNAESARMQKTSDTIAGILGIADEAAKRFGREGFVQDVDQDLLDAADRDLAAIEAAKQARVAELSKGRDISDPAIQSEIGQVERSAREAAQRVQDGLRGALQRREAGRASQSQFEEDERRRQLQEDEAQRGAGLRQFQERAAAEALEASRALERAEAKAAEQAAKEQERAERQRQQEIERRARRIGLSAISDFGAGEVGGGAGGFSVNVQVGGADADRVANAFAAAAQPMVEQELGRVQSSLRARAHAGRVRRRQ